MIHIPITRLLLVLFLIIASYACIAAEQYRLGPEDTLVITVLHHTDVSGTVTVAPDGTIRLPIIGELNVTGLTIAECEARLLTALKGRFVSPEVTVALDKPRTARVYIFGAVRTPGAFELKDTRNIVGVIAAAGGLLYQSNLCTAGLYRLATNKTTPVNLTDALAGVESANLPLEVGDVINIEQISLIPVYLAGDAIKAGLYQVPLGTTLSQLIATAGGFLGFTQQSPATAGALLAKPEDIRIVLTRGKENIPVNVPALSHGDAAADFVLREADAIRVESTLIKVYVSGEVIKPGVYLLSQGQGICEAVTLAGGISEVVTLAGGITVYAAPAKTTIAHRDGTQDVVDYPALQEKGANHPLQDGDRITIPTSTAKIAVLGMVTAPGAFPLDERHPQTVMDAIAMAKGTQQRAVISAVCVIRMVDGKPQRIPINLHAILKKDDLRTNITLKADDIVYVPETKMPDWSTVFGVISSFYYAHLVL